MEFLVSDITLTNSCSVSSSSAAITGKRPINSGIIPNLIKSCVLASLKEDFSTFSLIAFTSVLKPIDF